MSQKNLQKVDFTEATERVTRNIDCRNSESNTKRFEGNEIVNSETELAAIRSILKENDSWMKQGRSSNHSCKREGSSSAGSRRSSENSFAFNTKRSSRFENIEMELEEEIKEELNMKISKRDLEAIEEDAVKEVENIINSIDDELEQESTRSSRANSIQGSEGRSRQNSLQSSEGRSRQNSLQGSEGRSRQNSMQDSEGCSRQNSWQGSEREKNDPGRNVNDGEGKYGTSL